MPARLALVAMLLAVAGGPAAGQERGRAALVFEEATVGAPGSRRAGELYLPEAQGRAPAVVVMHGCSGVTAAARRWARRVASWGYAALLVDGFGPRGVENVCSRGSFVPPALRAADAFAAAAYLRGRADVDPVRIALVGFSHGGAAALVAATRAAAARLGPPFAAVVAFYPRCWSRDVPLASDVLILIGEADDWTPAGRCRAQAARWRPELGSLTVHVYEGATHAFDALGPERVYFGHRMRHDAAAAEDAAARVRAHLRTGFAR